MKSAFKSYTCENDTPENYVKWKHFSTLQATIFDTLIPLTKCMNTLCIQILLNIYSNYFNRMRQWGVILTFVVQVYCKTSNISRTLAGNEIAPVGAAPTTSSFST